MESKEDKFVWTTYSGFEIGFVYRGYDGLMARVKEEFIDNTQPKQGFFDFFALTGPWEKLKHDTLLNLIYNHCTLDDCERIWRGESPTNLNLDDRRKAILYALTLLMFEQEVNFGKEVWQRWSQFNPSKQSPTWRRPRDLFMGYIKTIFEEQDVGSIEPYKNKNGLLSPPPAGSKIRVNYFQVYENDNQAEALMTGETLKAFQEHIKNESLNPNYEKLINKKGIKN